MGEWQFCDDYFSQSAIKWWRWRWTMSWIRSNQCWPSTHQVYNIQYNTFSQLIICIFSKISREGELLTITSSKLCLIFCTLMFGVVVFCHEIWNKIQHGLISYCFLHDKKALLQWIGSAVSVRLQLQNIYLCLRIQSKYWRNIAPLAAFV